MGFVPDSRSQRQWPSGGSGSFTEHRVEIGFATQTLVRWHQQAPFGEIRFDRAHMASVARSRSHTRFGHHQEASLVRPYQQTVRGDGRSDDRQTSTPTGTSTLQHRAPAPTGHALEKSMLSLARNSLWLIRAFRHRFPHHITGHTDPIDEECRTSTVQYTSEVDSTGVAWTAQRRHCLVIRRHAIATLTATALLVRSPGTRPDSRLRIAHSFW